MFNRPVYAVREVSRENYSPMLPERMFQDRTAGTIQVYVDVVGGQEWINANRADYIPAKRG